MRLGSEALDLDIFRAFLATQQAVIEEPKGAEVLRFKIGVARGIIARRKDGSFTLASIAKPLYRQFAGTQPPAEKAHLQAVAAKTEKRSLRVVTTTLTAADKMAARELLASVKRAEVFTDGSCALGGAGPGGWAAVIRAGIVNVEISGIGRDTTVNRMEIFAAIAALEILPEGCAVKIKTDSQYLRKGITDWIDRWKVNGWRLSTGAPVKNEDLWRRLDEARIGRTVTWKWVPAHRGIRHNERADELARFARTGINQKGFANGRIT